MAGSSQGIGHVQIIVSVSFFDESMGETERAVISAASGLWALLPSSVPLKRKKKKAAKFSVKIGHWL